MSRSPLTDAQLRAELERCETCEAKPCRSGCPAGCSPADFIQAARCGEPSDYRRAAAHILAHNPLGGVCGSVCPDSLCMARCSRRGLDAAVEIPAVQAAILQRAAELGALPRFEPLPATGQRVAVVGAGPAGLGAASVLAKAGHTVRVFDRARRPGGMARLVPRGRLAPEVLARDVAWILGLGDLRLVLGKPVPLPRELLARGFAAVVVAAGLGEPVELEVPGRERAVHWTEVLGGRPPRLRGRRVAVVGDGAVAVDCAEAALAQGAAHVELFARRKPSELELTRRERERLFASGVHLSCRVRVAAIRGRGARVTGLELRKVELPAGEAFHPSRLADLPHGAHERRDLDAVVLALGGRPGLRLEPHPRVVYAGDLETGPTSVVEAVASGKRAALAIHRLLAGDELATCPDRASCAEGTACPQRATCPEWSRPAAPERASRGGRAPAGMPVALTTDFFGRALASPFLLSPAPATEGYARTKKAYDAGWAGAVLSAADEGGATGLRASGLASGGATARARGARRDDAPRDPRRAGGGIRTAALDRLCEDLERLRREFPDRLTIASAGGPLTGDDDADARAWQACTRRLDAAGAMAVEYSLSSPGRRDGADEDGGALDSQRAARVVEWVLAVSDPGVPKLFRLGADVAAGALLARVAAVLARHPGQRAVVTIAEPAAGDPFAWRPAAATSGGILRGVSGDRVPPASRLALASAARLGLVTSADGGAMDYRAAASSLALGARTVQLSTIVTRYGLGVVHELHAGLAHFLADRGLRSVQELVGSARSASTGEVSAARAVWAVDPALCTGCGNCSRCAHGAIALDARGFPAVDGRLCTGCSTCVRQCFAGALALRAEG